VDELDFRIVLTICGDGFGGRMKKPATISAPHNKRGVLQGSRAGNAIVLRRKLDETTQHKPAVYDDALVLLHKTWIGRDGHSLYAAAQ
jgi:hypothetical protein